MKIVDQIPSDLLDAVNEFSRRLEWARRLPIYEIHKWWARRYSGIIRLFLIFSELDNSILDNIEDPYTFVKEIYFNPPKVRGKKLLDPFCGGGTIVVEASNLGYEAHGIEINRLAYLMLRTVKSLPKLNFEYMRDKIIQISASLSEIWATKCARGHKATIIHTFLAWKNQAGVLQVKFNKLKDGNEKIYFCEKCTQLYKSKFNLKKCKFCDAPFEKKYQKIEYANIWPFAIEYFCPECENRDFKLMTQEDRKKFNLRMSTDLVPIPSLTETNRLLKAGFNDFGELLTPRQLFTFKKFLNSFRKEPYQTAAKLLVSDSLRCCSLLAYYSNRYKKVIPGFVIKSYWLPAQPVELNPLSFQLSKNGTILPLGRGNIISSFRKFEKARKFIGNEQMDLKFKLYYGPAQDVIPKLKDTYDIIFTDPPYGDYQFYSDLSLFGLSVIREIKPNFLRVLSEKEITIRCKKDVDKYKKGLKRVFSLALKKLSKTGRIFLTFHHPDINLLFDVLRVFKDLKLNLHAIYPVIGESSGKLARRKLYLDLIFIFGWKKKRPYFTYTNCFITNHDKQLQESIEKLINFYEE